MSNLDKEEWKPIPKFKGEYEASTLGRIRSVDRIVIDSIGRRHAYKGMVIKQSIDSDGYNIVTLFGKTQKVHRLVASTFILNENKLPQINHKNEIKTDNRVDNLEWCDAKYNANYGTAKARKMFTYKSRHGEDFISNLGKKYSKKATEASVLKTRKSVLQFTLNNIFIKRFDSISSAVRETNIYKSGIIRACKGEYKQAGGFIWKYE